ncbi:MAG: hypothetical protein U5K43_14270 [Halofilum sp. (in: g-proteobacteria)]|nr:hypothetical protein [Halofilum sp. (in: g-proteobacteria)]
MHRLGQVAGVVLVVVAHVEHHRAVLDAPARVGGLDLGDLLPGGGDEVLCGLGHCALRGS